MSWRNRFLLTLVACCLLAVVPVPAQDDDVVQEEKAEGEPAEEVEAAEEASELEEEVDRAAMRAERRALRMRRRAELEAESESAAAGATSADGEASEEGSTEADDAEAEGSAKAEDSTEADASSREAEEVPCVPSPPRDESSDDPEEEDDSEDADLDDGSEPDENADSGEDAELADDESGDDADLEPDCDPDRPALLVFTTDSATTIYVDGSPEGWLEPDDTLEVRVGLGETEIRAVSREALGASWEKTIELDKPVLREVNVRMERAIRKFRQEERRSGVFSDRKSSLMWPRRDNARDVDLRKAYAYCRDLETGGYEDWRLPTLEEIRTLEAVWLRATYKILGGIVLSECCVWSSDYDGTSLAKTFNFRYRQEFDSNAGYELGYRALCVREWDPEAEDAARAAAAVAREAEAAQEAASEGPVEEDGAADGL